MNRKTLFAFAIAALLAAPVLADPTVATVTGTLDSAADLAVTLCVSTGEVFACVPFRVMVLSVETDSGEIARVLVHGDPLVSEAAALTLGEPVDVLARWGERHFVGSIPIDVDFLALSFGN